MPDFVPLHRGDRWRPTASEINAFREAALAHALSNGRGKTPARTIPPNSGVVTVVNTSGSLVERGGVLGIDSPVITPDENADEFARLVLLNGVAPVAGTHEGKFVVTLQSIPDGQSGLAVISGAVAVQVDIQTEGDAFCDIADGDTAKLKSGTGSARILWAAGTTGTQWAIVLMGAGVSAPVLAKITGVFNDYLMVKRTDANGEVVGEAFAVAKPYKLRHVVGNYPLITSLTTNDENEVEVSDGSTTETWNVYPATYAVDDPVYILRVGHTGVEVEGADLKWIDLNVDGRAWAYVV